MAHTLAMESDSDAGVTFRCATCGAVCMFVHLAYGSPNPELDASNNWVPPENPEQWMGPCTQ